MTEINEANHYDSSLEIKQEELHIIDVCQEESFQDDLETDPSDQSNLSHGQNSSLRSNPDNRNGTISPTSQVDSNISQGGLDPNDLQTCLLVLRESITFIGDIRQMSKCE